MRYRLNFNGQQVHGSYSSLTAAARERARHPEGYSITWIQVQDPETLEWFRVPESKYLSKKP